MSPSRSFLAYVTLAHMLLKSELTKTLMTRMKDLSERRSRLQARSNEVLTLSKRAIFAVHRGDLPGAMQGLQEARLAIKEIKVLIQKTSRLAQEGSWRAAQEEFAEASLVMQYVTHHQVGRVREISDDPDLFLGALSDMTGELTRRAVLLASERQDDEVRRIFHDVREAVDFLLQMDLTGSLRTKVDQAKQNLRKLEEIQYDLSLRRGV